MAKVAKQATQKYPIEELKDHCRALFGVGPEVVDGALYGRSETEFTVDELKRLIEDFLRREAK